MNAPYLTIAGEPIKIGTLYYTVNKYTLKINPHNAGNENNTVDNIYFLQEKEATMYANLKALYNDLHKIIVDVEKTNGTKI